MQTTTDEISSSPLIFANSIKEALSGLKSAGSKSILLAGGTWLMRAEARQETNNKVFVSLAGIEELHVTEVSEASIKVGSMVTHDALSKAVVGMEDLAGLFYAANNSANPAIRLMATVGGNICTTEFAAADLLPVLLSLDATIELQSLSGTRKISVADFVANGRRLTNAELLTHIHIPRSGRFSSHTRLLMRKAGEYPVANLSLCADFDHGGKISFVRIVVGSVEMQPKRWIGLERTILGARAIEIDVKGLAKSHVDEFEGREGTDAPAWYRKKILPVLASRAFSEAVLSYNMSAI
ncbi:MAG: FAD binding domain-containing protein [Sneathiella sp.]|uniref:FAD binding domain-containing protein n=1 Tax=Sneathiella sp. TaxID=1964365 RepID=UPI0030015E71